MSQSVLDVCRAGAAFELRPLPPRVQDLLTKAKAPPRLVAHLHLVHDVAAELTSGCTTRIPAARIDEAAVAFGAATHDVGKALFPAELSGAGNEHELGGEAWLIAQGTSPDLARFARTHGLDPSDRTLLVEDLLVIAADKLWKSKRVAAVEERLIGALASSAGQDYWDVWSPLSALFDELAQGAEARLSWQAQFSV